MITVENYSESIKGATIPKDLIEGHKYMVEYGDLYNDDRDIKEAIDFYLQILNSRVKKANPSPTPQKKVAKSKITCPPTDSNGVKRIDPKGIELLKDCIAKEKDTKASNTNANGEYTNERTKLHDRIIEDFKKQKPCRRDKPIAILTGGPPGSGKSYFLKHYAPWMVSGKLFHIDADEVRANLPEYKGWNADNTQPETSDIVKKMLLSIGEPCEYDLIYDGTMNKAKNYLPLVDRLKKMGYRVFVIYMQVPKEVSISRAMERYQRTGRYVPLEVIEEVFDRGLAAFEEVIKQSDGYIRVNGETHEILEQGGAEIPKDRNYNFKKSSGKKKENDCPPETKKKAAGKKPIKAKAKSADQFIADLMKQPGKVSKLSENQVIKVGLLFHRKYRSPKAQADSKRDSAKRLSPTPTNLLRWMKHPGQFDLIGVDTFSRTDQTADYKRLISKQKFWNLYGIKY